MVIDIFSEIYSVQCFKPYEENAPEYLKQIGTLSRED